MSLRDVTKITVKITAADIEAGLPNTSDLCPIALALHREYPRVRGVAVDTNHVFLGRWVWLLDRRGVEFIQRFDEHRLTRPRTITLVKEGSADVDAATFQFPEDKSS